MFSPHPGEFAGNPLYFTWHSHVFLSSWYGHFHVFPSPWGILGKSPVFYLAFPCFPLTLVDSHVFSPLPGEFPGNPLYFTWHSYVFPSPWWILMCFPLTLGNSWEIPCILPGIPMFSHHPGGFSCVFPSPWGIQGNPLYFTWHSHVFPSPWWILMCFLR